MKHTCFFFILVLFMLSCKKDDPEPKYISLDDPDNVITSVTPGNNESGIATSIDPVIAFNYNIVDLYINESEYYLKIDSISLSDEDSTLTIQLLKPNRKTIKITPVDSIEMCCTYNIYLKAHLMVKDGKQWTDNAPNGSIEYYEYNFVFQTLFPDFNPMLYPGNNDDSVSIYALPSALFNFPIDSTVFLEDINNPFQLKLDYLRLSCNNQDITGDIVISGNKAQFNPDEWLPSNSTIIMEVKATWQKQVNTDWINCTDLDNNEICEIEEITFKTTKEQILLIDKSVIEATYPVYRQYHFLKSEYEYGYILFNEPADNIFVSNLNGINCTYKAIVTENQGSEKFVQDVKYISTDKLARYTAPSALKNETIYNIKLVRIVNSDTSLLYENYFRTSMFDDFDSKFAAYNYPRNSYIGASYVGERGQVLQNAVETASECLDLAEVNTGGYYSSIGLFRADLKVEDNNYFDTYVTPYLYETWSYEGYSPELTRNEYPYGIPPVHTGRIETNGNTKYLTDEEIASNNAARVTAGYFKPNYYTNYVVYNDFIDIQAHIKERFTYSDELDEKVKYIYNFSSMKLYTNGIYKAELYYQLPGLDIITTDLGEFTYTL